jgi:hypothetical protein
MEPEQRRRLEQALLWLDDARSKLEGVVEVYPHHATGRRLRGTHDELVRVRELIVDVLNESDPDAEPEPLVPSD